jgi:hypothetical protein
VVYEGKFEDTKDVIRICISQKDRQCNGQKKKKTKGQTMINKTLKWNERLSNPKPTKNRGW